MKEYIFTTTQLMAFCQALSLDLNASLRRDPQELITALRTSDFANFAVKTAERFSGRICISKAMERVLDELRSDVEYRKSWEANLACSFRDALSAQDVTPDQVVNDGAKRFMELLLLQVDDEKEQ